MRYVALRPDVPPLSGDRLRTQAAYYWNAAATNMTITKREPLLRLAEQCENLAQSIDEVARGR